MRVLRLIVIFLSVTIFSFAQNKDSLMQVQWESALKKLKAGDNNDAVVQFSQLINSNFSNKEVYVKRGVAYYNQKEYNKAKDDFDEAVKARINTSELYEYRGNARYGMD